MPRLIWFIAAVSLSAGLAAQDGGGPCGAGEPTLYLDSPGAAGGTLVKRFSWVSPRELEVTARLRLAFTEPETAVQGYAISVEHTEWPFEIIEVTSEGMNEIASRGFVKTEVVQNGPRRGFVSAALTCDCSLPPIGDFPLARARYRVHFGAETLLFLELEGRIEYRDGLQGSGQPVRNMLTVNGDARTPCLEPLAVTILVESPHFSRGDANADRDLDISDPVHLLRSLFQADAVVRCADAADANDDGKLDISDAIHILSYLFQDGPPPRPPFPDAGWDLTPDELGCFAKASRG